MGHGAWADSAYRKYSASVGRAVDIDGTVSGKDSAQEMFRSYGLDVALNPYKVTRECRDSEEHPNTIPVILALDVTGSMGSASARVARKLNVIMTDLYNKVKDVEFMVMGIGDFAYDSAPLQVSQFESDIRIAEQLDKVYFEGHGGGNSYESYTGAWYFALNHTDCDCWKRGKKGIIITMGDEPLNPYLPYKRLSEYIGDSLQGDVETEELYRDVTEKYDVYHLAVDDVDTCYNRYESGIKTTYGKYLDEKHLFTVTLDSLAPTIVDIVTKHANNTQTITNANGEIAW